MSPAHGATDIAERHVLVGAELDLLADQPDIPELGLADREDVAPRRAADEVVA